MGTKTPTPKQLLWLQSYLDESNPVTFFNKTGSARAAQYRCNSDAAFRAVGYQNFTKLHHLIDQWLDEHGLSEARLKSLLAEGLNCVETRFFTHQGKVTETREVVPLETRRRYLEMALKVKGLFAAEKHEISGRGGGPIDLTEIVMKVTEKNGVGGKGK